MSSDSTDIPKKRKKVKPPAPTREDFESYAQLIREANMLYSDKKQTARKEAEEYREHIEKFLREYLKSYVILGYDTHGERVLFTHADTSEEKDALLTYLTKYFIALNKGAQD